MNAPIDFIATVKVDAGALESALESHLGEMRELVARMEAAAATVGTDTMVIAEAEPLEGFAVATLRSAPAAAPGLGMLATAVVAGAALAGSTTRRVSRRALMSFGFLRERGE
jgi:hypothetical protein